MKPLKPVMAALLAAASASFATPGTAFATTPKKPAAAQADCVKALDDAATDPVNALTCLVQKKPEARKDIGDRMASFVQGKDPGRQYLTDALLKDAETLKLVVAEAKGWPEANKKTPAKVAILYFVVGPETDALPAWAQVKALQGKLKPKMGWSDRLAVGLTSDHWSDTKQVAQQDAANGTAAFLNAAADWAKKVMDDPRSKKELGDSVKGNDTTDPLIPKVDPGVGNRTNRNPATYGAGFTRDDLYKTGAKVKHIFAPGDDGFREVSMKIYTVRNDDGSLQNMIGLVDNTDCQGVKGCPQGPFKPRFIPVTATGPQTITLRDGGGPYEVNIDGDRITLGRPGVKPNPGAPGGEDGVLSTSFAELYNLRADQCRTAGTVKVPDPDGKEYYVISQADVCPGSPNRDARGDLLLFDKSVIDNPQADPRLLRPTTSFPVRMLDKDGVTVDVNWSPDMGLMPDGKNPDGSQKMSPFHMVKVDGVWKPKSGAGDVDPAKPKAAPPAAANPATAGTTTPADGTTPAPTPTSGSANVVVDGATNLEQIVGFAKQATPPWADGDNGGFTPEVAKMIHIMTGMDGKDRVFGVFFDPKMGVPGHQFAFPKQLGGQPVKMIRAAAGKYVVVVYPKQVQYWDYQTFAKYVSGGDAAKSVNYTYAWAPGNPGIQAVDDLAVVFDMVKLYKSVDPKLEATVKANLKKFVKGPFKISGNSTTLTATFGKDDSGSAEVWPEGLLKSPDTGNNDGLTDQQGPGTVYTLAGGGTGPFQKTITLDGEWSTDGGGEINEAAGYALYVGKQPALNKEGVTTMYKRYAIMLRYKKLKDSEPILSKLIPIFGEKGDPQFYAKPAELHLTGYPNEVLGDTSLLRMFANTTEEDGAISAYRTPASPGNMKDPKRNCVGPVVWWGITKTQAQEHCQSDSKTSD